MLGVAGESESHSHQHSRRVLRSNGGKWVPESVHLGDGVMPELEGDGAGGNRAAAAIVWGGGVEPDDHRAQSGGGIGDPCSIRHKRALQKKCGDGDSDVVRWATGG